MSARCSGQCGGWLVEAVRRLGWIAFAVIEIWLLVDVMHKLPIFAAWGALIGMTGFALLILYQIAALLHILKPTRAVRMRCVLVWLSTMGTLAGAEAAMQGARAARGEPFMEISPEYRLRRVRVEGVHKAYYWQNRLHLEDEHRMRYVAKRPPRRDDVFRIMVVGDSYTFGTGVPADQTYPAKLEQQLRKTFSVEVINCGVRGFQSEDVLYRAVIPMVAELDPDLVVYGICLNDFLATTNDPVFFNRWNVKLRHYLEGTNKRYVRTLREFFSWRTIVGPLIWGGITNDFYDQMLAEFDVYQQRFEQDLRKMNQLVTDRGKPPVVAMVVNHFLETVDERAIELTNAAERIAADVGMTVVPAAGYYQRNAGRPMRVSKWEDHPNPVAMNMFAAELAAFIASTQEIQPYRLNHE